MQMLTVDHHLRRHHRTLCDQPEQRKLRRFDNYHFVNVTDVMRLAKEEGLSGQEAAARLAMHALMAIPDQYRVRLCLAAVLLIVPHFIYAECTCAWSEQPALRHMVSRTSLSVMRASLSQAIRRLGLLGADTLPTVRALVGPGPLPPPLLPDGPMSLPPGSTGRAVAMLTCPLTGVMLSRACKLVVGNTATFPLGKDTARLFTLIMLIVLAGEMHW